jgi:hypothetical protein
MSLTSPAKTAGSNPAEPPYPPPVNSLAALRKLVVFPTTIALNYYLVVLRLSVALIPVKVLKSWVVHSQLETPLLRETLWPILAEAAAASMESLGHVIPDF